MRNIGRLQWLSEKLNCWATYVRAFLLILMNLSLLGIYVILLLPAFLQMAWFYVTTNRISVRYKNDSCRNTVDIYCFDPKSVPKGNNVQQIQPVVFFLPGGAYCLGYKMWGALIAQALRPSGVLVVSADYRNYPFGKVPDMIQDAADALQWTIDHCHEYGGDQRRIVIVGQSAGAHLGIMALLLNQTTSDLSQNIRGFVGLSGIYDMQEATNLFSRKLSLHPSVISEQLFSQHPDSCDPAVWLKLQTQRPFLPPIELWHGSSDTTIPWRVSHDFASLLEKYKYRVKFQLLPEWSHTDAILEAIFEGNHEFHQTLCQQVSTWCNQPLEFQTPDSSPRCFPILVNLARKVSPF